MNLQPKSKRPSPIILELSVFRVHFLNSSNLKLILTSISKIAKKSTAIKGVRGQQVIEY